LLKVIAVCIDHPHVDLSCIPSSAPQYVTNQLKQQESYDMLVLKEIITQVTGIITVDDLNEGQVSKAPPIERPLNAHRQSSTFICADDIFWGASLSNLTSCYLILKEYACVQLLPFVVPIVSTRTCNSSKV
jgi:hypothetical protein